MTKTILTSAAVAFLVGLGVWLMLPAKMTTVTKQVNGDNQFGNTSIDGSQANLPNPTNFDYLVARVALGLGTNLTNSNTGAGNVLGEGQAVNATSGTSTPCVIQNPFNATSTIQTFSMNITTATSTNVTWVIGTSTSQYATSSSMVTTTIVSGALGTITWDAGVNNAMIGPLTYITVGTAAGTIGYNTGGVVFAARCQATFQSVNN